MDVLAATGANRWGPASPPSPEQKSEFDRADAARQAAFRAELRTLLGDAAFSAFERYEETGPARIQVARLATRLSYSDAPLTQDQQAHLVAWMGRPEFEGKAQEILSAPQWERWQELERERSRKR